jgi:hypothetical protein
MRYSNFLFHKQRGKFMFFKQNPDKVPQTLLIVIIVIMITAIASGIYHSEKNTNDTPIAAMSRSGGL